MNNEYESSFWPWEHDFEKIILIQGILSIFGVFSSILWPSAFMIISLMSPLGGSLETPFLEIFYNHPSKTGMLFVVTDLGPGQWEAKTLSDRTHQHSPWCGSQQPQPLPVLLWWRQASQMLGSGVQQGMLLWWVSGQHDVIQKNLTF